MKQLIISFFIFLMPYSYGQNIPVDSIGNIKYTGVCKSNNLDDLRNLILTFEGHESRNIDVFENGKQLIATCITNLNSEFNNETWFMGTLQYVITCKLIEGKINYSITNLKHTGYKGQSSNSNRTSIGNLSSILNSTDEKNKGFYSKILKLSDSSIGNFIGRL